MILDGYKTYICVILGMILSMIYGMGYIEFEAYIWILSFLGFGSAGALRIALKKIIMGNGK